MGGKVVLDVLLALMQADFLIAADLRDHLHTTEHRRGAIDQKEQDLGTVEAGKIADIVLLDADPLQDINNTRRINAVVVNGRLLDRAALDALLAQVEATANQ